MTGMCELMENLLCRTLSPTQRYSAMRHLQTDPMPDFLTNKWFVLLSWSLVVVLVVLFFAVRRMRQEKDRLAMEKRFLETADRCQLTTQERELLEAVCRYADVPQKDDIFADTAAFDLGFVRLIQESFEAGHNLVQRKQLNIIVQGIRSKLGLQKSQSTLSCTVRDSKSLSSRQIPPNSGILVELVSGTKVLRFGATVTRNDTYELVLSTVTAIE
ncbi:MAG: hypothetical protein IMZ71_05385, partial [Chloroflexi bacterium]|nr:hypothetical protein [Chloroflexota bacterium]